MTVLHGDCLSVMKEMESNSIDAIVTDPPYGLSFMGKKWDYDVPSQEIWEEALRVLKPGGYLLAFAGTRTQHRMAIRIEDAGFEIRDMIAWIYGSGFPKSLNIGKAVDKLLGNEREIIDTKDVGHDITSGGYKDTKIERKIMDITKGSSEWEGFGTALKPALEPITVARKSLSEKTVAENCLKWGVGGLDIDGSRVESSPEDKIMMDNKASRNPTTNYSDSPDKIYSAFKEDRASASNPIGRFPANLIHDGSDEVIGLFPESKSTGGSGEKSMGGLGKSKYGKFALNIKASNIGGLGDSGSAARFFYCAKASGKERGESNNHPTVKPIALMEYLVSLVSREGQTILDPFAGSGTTGIACRNKNRKYVLIERDEKSVEIINDRLRQREPIKDDRPEIIEPSLFDILF